MANKYLRIYRPLSTIILLLLVGYTSNATSKTLIDNIAIIVNSDIIVESEIAQHVSSYKLNPENKKDLALPKSELRKKVVEQLILRTIKLSLAKDRGIKATIEHIDSVLALLAKQNNLNQTQLKKVIEQQQGSYLQFRKKLADDYIINQLEQSTIHSKIQLNANDLKEEMLNIEKSRNIDSKYHLIHYLINSDTLDNNSLSLEAINIRKQLLNKTLMADIKKQSNIKLQNKDLGLLSSKSLPNIFINAVSGLSKGDISEPIITENGIHLLHVINKEGAPRIIIPEMKARHILLKINQLRDEKKAIKQITALRQKIRAGGDFAKIAKKHSEDPGSAVNGGDLGWFGPGKMVEAFEEQLIKLQINETSEPFKTQFGWHLVQLQGKRKTDVTEERTRLFAKKQLLAKKVATDLKRWENRIKQEAFIEFK